MFTLLPYWHHGTAPYVANTVTLIKLYGNKSINIVSQEKSWELHFTIWITLKHIFERHVRSHNENIKIIIKMLICGGNSARTPMWIVVYCLLGLVDFPCDVRGLMHRLKNCEGEILWGFGVGVARSWVCTETLTWRVDCCNLCFPIVFASISLIC